MKKIKFLDYISIVLAFITVIVSFADLLGVISIENNKMLYIFYGIALGYFVVEYIFRLYLARDKKEFLKTHKLDLLAIIPLSGFKIFRILAIFKRFNRKIDKFLHYNNFSYLLYATGLMLLLASISIYFVERNVGAIDTVGKAVWWCCVTVTTVGYGDLVPVTAVGRIIAVLLMMFGIGLIGAFTANVASYFVNKEKIRKEKKSQKHSAVENNEFKFDSSLVSDFSNEEYEELVNYIGYIKSKRD